MSVLNESFINEAFEAYDKWLGFLQQLGKRINYIIETVIFGFNVKHRGYEFSESEAIMQYRRKDFITYEGEWISEDMFIIDKNGDKLDLEGQFPSRWLVEDFEEELKNGMKLYVEKQNAAKEKRRLSSLESKMQKNKLRDAAISKLSPEERKVLGLK